MKKTIKVIAILMLIIWNNSLFSQQNFQKLQKYVDVWQSTNYNLRYVNWIQLARFDNLEPAVYKIETTALRGSFPYVGNFISNLDYVAFVDGKTSYEFESNNGVLTQITQCEVSSSGYSPMVMLSFDSFGLNYLYTGQSFGVTTKVLRAKKFLGIIVGWDEIYHGSTGVFVSPIGIVKLTQDYNDKVPRYYEATERIHLLPGFHSIAHQGSFMIARIVESPDFFENKMALVANTDTSNVNDNNSKKLQTGTSEIGKSKSNIKLYPNPAKENVFIEVNTENNNNNLTFEVYNIMGSKILSQEIHNGQKTSVNTSDLKVGAYSYRVISDGQLIKTDKLIIAR